MKRSTDNSFNKIIAKAIDYSTIDESRFEDTLRLFVKGCREHFSSNSPHAVNGIQGRLTALGVAFGRQAISKLLSGNREEFTENFRTSIECYRWAAKCSWRWYYSFDDQEKPIRFRRIRSVITQASVVFIADIANRNTAGEREMWGLLSQLAGDRVPFVEEWWNGRGFEPFLVALYAEVEKIQAPLVGSGFRFGPYGPILDHWNNEALLPEIFFNACEYHVQNMIGSYDGEPEFAYPPFGIIPVEIHCLNELRIRHGLEAVAVKHPLMESTDVTLPLPVTAINAQIKELIDTTRELYF